MRRASFLTIFLGALTVAFLIALALRIRSDRESINASGPAAPTAAVATSSEVPSLHDTANTMTVQPVPMNGGETAPTSTTTMTERERLREQLMRAPFATPPAVPAHTATTSTTATAAPPIKPQPQPKPQPHSSMPPSAVQQRLAAAAAAQQSGGGSSSSSEAAAPKDPNSDTVPPRLMAISFEPPEVQDGQEAHVVMVATDDLSGIRGISGTITSPNGKALQGFAGQREGDTNRYVGRFGVPKDGEEGLWRVNVVTMSDNASNTVTLSLAQGTLPANSGLRVVSSQSDSTPPTLKSVRAENRSMRAGEANPVSIEAEDDKSGVNLVSAVFQSPNKRARIGAGCMHAGGDLWTCQLSLPTCIDCGDWQLEQVTLQDKASNLATFRTDNPLVAAVKINIGGDSCDSEAPRLYSVAFDQNIVTMGSSPAVVTVTIVGSDDACGVEGVSAQYTGPGAGTGGFFPFQPAGDDQTWVGRIPLDPRAPRGTWRITSVQLTDKGHNLRIYYANDPLLANATFQVR